jgi:hypothetical protein
VAEKDDYLVDILVDLGFVSAEKVAWVWWTSW